MVIIILLLIMIMLLMLLLLLLLLLMLLPPPLHVAATAFVRRRHRVGDIGPKIGFNTMDNGFCSFDHVRIPRGNMAMRHQTVDRDGTYTKTASKEGGKIAYITVMQVSVRGRQKHRKGR